MPTLQHPNNHAYQRLQFLRPEHPHPILLNDAQCQHLWRNIIKSDTSVTYSEGLLQAIMQAWEHSQQWQINREHEAFHYTPQTRQFQQWWHIFNKQLKELDLIN